ERALAAVPQSEGEHAGASPERFDQTPGDDPLKEHLGVRMATPAALRHGAALLELGAEVGVIVDLAVEGQHEAAVGRTHRLVTGPGQVCCDNADAPHRD